MEALNTWLAEARRLCAHYGRAEIGDHAIGQLLAKAPAGENGVWPCRPVCEALEGIASVEIAKGFHMAVHNARGVHWRGEGGDQERDLTARYRNWAQQIAFEFPYVAGVLEGIAVSYDREAGWHDTRAKVNKRLAR